MGFWCLFNHHHIHNAQFCVAFFIEARKQIEHLVLRIWWSIRRMMALTTTENKEHSLCLIVQHRFELTTLQSV